MTQIMTREEALELLEAAPKSDAPSKINPEMSQARAVSIVTAAIEVKPAGAKLDPIYIKRVYQVTRNQRRPRY